MYYKLYSDAAKYPDSNQVGIGILLVSNQQQTQVKFNLTANDNHEAEFKACLKALEFFKSQLKKNDFHNTILTFYTDSKILADSLNKRYAKHYQKYVDQILQMESEFSLVFNTWISESENRGAHELSIQALHEIT